MADFYIDKDKVINRLGLNPGGKVQALLDASVISHLRKNMPHKEGEMKRQTQRQKPGLIVIAVPYAHYQNEGIKYVMPENGKSAFFNPTYGYWSKPGVKKVSSGEPLNYHGGGGPHFVERTLNEDLDDILREVKRGMKQ